jgi:hypothetical protein
MRLKVYISMQRLIQDYCFVFLGGEVGTDIMEVTKTFLGVVEFNQFVGKVCLRTLPPIMYISSLKYQLYNYSERNPH